jgi:hypothetical protein
MAVRSLRRFIESDPERDAAPRKASRGNELNAHRPLIISVFDGAHSTLACACLFRSLRLNHEERYTDRGMDGGRFTILHRSCRRGYKAILRKA